MISGADLRRYIANRQSFRRKQIILPNGKRLGDCAGALADAPHLRPALLPLVSSR